MLQKVNNVFSKPESILYVMALKDTYFTSEFNSQNLPFEWVNVRLVSDDPIKGMGLNKDSDLLLYRLDSLIESRIGKLDLVSPYFVPAKVGTQTFLKMVEEGAQIRILTNALEATDVAAVHSGYIKRDRKSTRLNSSHVRISY